MKAWAAAVSMIVLFAAFQVVAVKIDAWPLNFQPLLALAFCSVALLSGRQSLIVGAAWLIAWPLLSAIRGYDFTEGLLATALGFACVFLIGFAFRHARSIWAALGGVTLSAITFYFVTNTFSFFELGWLYPRSLEGFLQAQWTGPDRPGFGPTWVFLRNSITGSLFFTTLVYFSVSKASEAPETDEEIVDDEETETA